MAKTATTYTVRLGETQLTARSVEYGAVQFETDRKQLQLQQGQTLWDWRSAGYDREGDTALALEPGEGDHEYLVYVKGEVLLITLETPRDRHLKTLSVATAGGRTALQLVRAPMPGLLKSILVNEGEKIDKGASLCILEAMKMENEIKAPGDFIVGTISVEPGNPVEKGATLLQLLPIEEPVS